MNPKLKLLIILILTFIIYPITLILVSKLFNEITYLQALLYVFIVRILKFNIQNKIEL